MHISSYIVQMNRSIKKIRSWFQKRTKAFWLRTIAYVIPIGFLLYILYFNFLPFGYSKSFMIQVGSYGDKSGEFSLESTPGLGDRMTANDGTTYRELSGFGFATYKPSAILRHATGTVSVSEPGVYLIDPTLSFDPNSLSWNKNWDFTSSITSEFQGTTTSMNGCADFNGANSLELPNSDDEFENGPFSVYVEWDPKDEVADSQEIIGHSNWELFQDKSDVRFQVGKMNGSNGMIYSIRHPIDDDFFNMRHSAFAIYYPESATNTNGYIDLYVDNEFTGRTYFLGDTIWSDPNASENLTLGKSANEDAYFNGCIYTAKILNQEIDTTARTVTFPIQGLKKSYSVPLINASSTSVILKSVNLNVVQN